MIRQAGYWWPDDVGDAWRHALRHVGSLEWAIAACRERRTAVQAGGNVGLWPRRLAESFARVYTFEPDARARACLEKNVLANVIVSAAAVGERAGVCALDHRGLGSHRIIEGDAVPVVPIDDLALTDCDLLQLDIEGYEWHALAGARATLARCRPIVQVELRGFTNKYGQTDQAVRHLLAGLEYRLACERPGSDFVFVPRRVTA
jgi:FkbM family methyltransferase